MTHVEWTGDIDINLQSCELELQVQLRIQAEVCPAIGD